MARRWKSLGMSALLLPGLAVGCGIGRWDVQPPKQGPIGIAPLPPIHETINGGEGRDDKVALARPSAETPDSPPAQSRIRRAPWARDPESVATAARSAPAVPTPPEPNRGEPPAFPIETPTESASMPAPDRLPTPIESPTEPASPPTIPNRPPVGDPSMGPNPDAVPNIELPAKPPAALPATPERPTIPAEGSPPTPTPEPSKPVGDPSMGPNPDAVPNIELPAKPPAPLPATPERPAIPAEGPPPAPTPEPSKPAGDPSMGPNPDAVPNIELPAKPPAALPATPERPATPAEGPPPTPTPEPAKPAGDPSMGPNPDAVPNIELPATTPEKPATPAEGPPTDATPPAVLPSLPPDEGAPPPEIPALPPTDATPPAGFPGLPPDGLPPIDPADVPPLSPANPSPTAQQTPIVDPAVQRASATTDRAMPPGAEWKVAPGKAASETAARVGDEIITLSELRTAVREQLRGMNLPAGQEISEADKNAIASLMLDRMIDRIILVQEAKRKIKDEKKWKQFMEALENVWKEKELPDLLRQHGVPDEYTLKKKLEGENLSLSDKHAAFIQNLMAREYLMGQVKDRIKVYAPAMREYYEAHRNDFDRPALVRWREVAIEVGKHADRAEARRKTEAVLAKLRRGDSFAKVAQAESEGPTASRGGIWETSPDGYNVPAVRDALTNLPPNQVSGILEGPDSFHVVLIESRRVAGPARFDEVQDEVRKILLSKKETDEMNTYLDGVRGRYVVTSMFDGSASAPGAGRRAMENSSGRRGR